MAEQPQDYALNAPREMPPVQPTEAFKPLNYTPPPHQAMPTQEIQNAPVPPPSQYTPPAGQFAPSAPMPARKKRGGAGVWVLGGCGVVAVIGFIFIAVIGKNVMDQLGKSDVMKNAASLPTAKRDLVEIRAGLDKYLQAHGNKYPAKLSDAVDASYLAYTSNSGEVKIQYTPPVSNAPGDTAVASFYVGQLNLSFGQTLRQRNYLSLLKDGTLVQEQITRTPLQTY